MLAVDMAGEAQRFSPASDIAEHVRGDREKQRNRRILAHRGAIRALGFQPVAVHRIE
jgi:hypothetical protein